MSLPIELIAGILSRLPVEPLLRFRCVCPPWRDLIDSPHFVKLHLNHSIERETNLNVIFHYQGLHIAKFQPLDCSLQATELDHHPLRSDEAGIQVLGSCNGLILLANDSNTFVLWNPSTRKHVKLPDGIRSETLAQPGISSSCYYGLGYDNVGDDYKVVRVVGIARDYSDKFSEYDVQVYSNNSHSWHMVENFPCFPCLQSESGKFAAGALHWTMGSEPKMVVSIVAFDLGTEEFRIVPGPKLDAFFQCETMVESFQETISLVVVINGYFDVWVMKVYGVENSWTKLFSVTHICRPMYCPKNSGEVLLQHDCGLIWFDTKHSKPWYESVKDTEHKNIKKIQICGMKAVAVADFCIGSLVPLCGSGKLSHERKKKTKTARKQNDMAGFLSKGFKLVL